MTEPINYEDWSKDTKPNELGIKVAITDKLLRSKTHEVIETVGRLMGQAMARAVFEGGHTIPLEFKHDRERDPSLRMWEHFFSCHVDRESIPEQYLYMAYNQWQKEYGLRLAWERKSLWQYILHCWDRWTEKEET